MLPGITEKIFNQVGQTPPPCLARLARRPRASLRARRRGPGERRLKLFHVRPKRHLSRRPFDH
jgi:hypothetical protein